MDPISIDEKTKVIFVGRHNMNRSRTAKAVFLRLLESSRLGDRYSVDSAGIDADIEYGPELEPEMADGCDILFAADRDVATCLRTLFGQSQEKIFDLDIPDIYPAHHRTMVQRVTPKLLNWLLDRLPPRSPEAIALLEILAGGGAARSGSSDSARHISHNPSIRLSETTQNGAWAVQTPEQAGTGRIWASLHGG